MSFQPTAPASSPTTTGIGLNGLSASFSAVSYKGKTYGVHPSLTVMTEDAEMWRLTLKSNREYLEKYLERHSDRETDAAFTTRKKISYIPAFAKVALYDVVGKLVRRMTQVSRTGLDSESQNRYNGLNGGVDRCGSSITAFFSSEVLPELLAMKRVGVYIDMEPVGEGLTYHDTKNLMPYFYIYRTEQILNWSLSPTQELQAVLLASVIDTIDETTGLVSGQVTEYRYLRLDQDAAGERFVSGFVKRGAAEAEPVRLNIPRIPFVIFGLTRSLLEDSARYQIAMLNVSSCDLSFATRSNFPFLTKQLSGQEMTARARTEAGDTATPTVEVGSNTGLGYGANTERPGYIAPPTDPFAANRAFMRDLQGEISLLTGVTLNTTSSANVSGDAQQHTDRRREFGLAAIDLELETCEQNLAEIWSLYIGEAPAEISYPIVYTDEPISSRLKDLADALKVISRIPSLTAQRVVLAQAIRLALASDLSEQELSSIDKEIHELKTLITDPEQVIKDHEAGLVGDVLASKLRGYPDGEAGRAQEDHGKRLQRIQQYQSSGANGPGASKPDKVGEDNDSSDGSPEEVRRTGGRGQSPSASDPSAAPQSASAGRKSDRKSPNE